MVLEQLPLGLQLRDDATFINFLVGDNQQAVAAILNLLQAPLNNLAENFVYVWGAFSSGRSHLLQASCHMAYELGYSGFYLPLQEYCTEPTEVLQGLEHVQLVCIDDIHCIAGDVEWEEQLFHFFNRIRALGHRLLITADQPPAQLPIKLPDLKSRLAWGIVYNLQPLQDEHKIAALQLRAHARGLELDLAVARFLLRRCPRDLGKLFMLLEQLDHASMAEQRRLTIPFVKDVLGV